MLVKLKIWRQTPTGEGSFKRELVDFEVETFEEATLLDCLDAIKHYQDGTLAYRKSCRMAICGSCGMRMDGRAVLACKTPMKDLVKKGRAPVIAPMGNMPVVRDLVTDMSDFWSKVRAMTPWLTRGSHGDAPADGREHLVSPEEQQKITKETMCIMCGCCVSECNSMEADPAFLGPAALAKGYRFVGDVRDKRTRERLEQYNGKHGVWECTRCYFCNERCPKGVDPRDAIAKLGAAMFDHGLTNDKGAKHAKVFIDSAKGQGPVPGSFGIEVPGSEILYNGHLSETALIPLTLGAEAAMPGWAAMGVKLGRKGKVPPPWHGALHRVKGLDEVRRLWRVLEAEESVERRGGDLEEPVKELPPNIAQGVRTQFTPEEIFERTGAVVSADITSDGGKLPPDQVDLSSYYGDTTVVQQFVAAGGLEQDHGLSGPVPTEYAAQQAAQIDAHGSRPGATTSKDA